MVDQRDNNSQRDSYGETFTTAFKVTQAIAQQLQKASESFGKTVATNGYDLVERSTEVVGKVAAPIANLPFIQFATKVPGIGWLMAAMGQVDEARVEQEIVELRRKYPADTEAELAQRLITEYAFKAAQVGLVANIVPPLAVLLFALDVGAVAALQANMIYRIAAIYGFPANDSTRRGEVLTIWGLTTSSSGMLKTGLSFLEILPGVGTAIGITVDAGLLYTVGAIATQFYEIKRQAD